MVHVGVRGRSLLTKPQHTQTGQSIIIVVTEEHAEHYVQQFKRQQIYAKMEKEGGNDN